MLPGQTQTAGSQTRSLPPHTHLTARKAPLLSHRCSNTNFRPPTLGPPATPLPATPTSTPPPYPAPQCPEPIFACQAEIVAEEPANDNPPTYAPAALPDPQVGPTPLPASSVAPPAYGSPPAIITLCLWRLEGPTNLSPQGSCYLQTAGRGQKDKIRLGTRIVCLDFRGWGTDRADRIRVAVRNRGEIGGRTVVQFATVPSSAGVVKDDDSFYICFFPGFVSETGWGEERGPKDSPLPSRFLRKFMSMFRL